MTRLQHPGVSKRFGTLQKAIPGTPETRREVKAAIRVEKSDVERGIVWGWGSVADLIDLQGDVIPQEELERAVYAFMEAYYQGRAAVGDNHEEVAEAVIVESALEWRGGALRWWLGIKLLSDELRQAARDGKISGFSIGGFAEVEEGEAGNGEDAA